MDEYFARDIMKEQVVTIDSSAAVIDAAKKMDEQEIGCVIVTERGNPVGIITERDFVRKIAVNEKPMSTPVKEVMSSPLISVDPDATIWELAEKLKLEKIHKMPVVHENKLVGIVTTTDITRLCSIGSDSEMRKVCQQILLRLNQS
ncbi:MAG: CBS domain-containing protein [Thaumarchaeota archaeon]|nr:CBS domain-containing protein [Nitrososphaerota archaeon]